MPVPEGATYSVAVKLPQFWPNDPRVWFVQVESEFAIRRVTSQETKYAYVVSALPPETALEVRDILLKSPKGDTPYDTLKAELIKRTSASEQRRLHQLLTAEELGDRTPSQLLRRMRQLLGDNTMEDNLLKQLFLQRLPNNVQLILAPTSGKSTVEELASVADRVLEVTPAPGQVSAVRAATRESADMAELRKMVSTLTEQVENLARQIREERSRSPSRDRNDDRRQRRRSKSRQRQYDPAGEQCWYHWRYAEKATKCRPPCSYVPKTSEGKGEASN